MAALLQTMQRSYDEILLGEDPWLPLGNFMHQFFGCYADRRAELVQEPLHMPDHPLSSEDQHWAVFCAASVDYLCQMYHLVCPAWVDTYTLHEPWYYTMGPDHPKVREKLRQTTPEEFTKRNIFCGNRTFLNKYEKRDRRQVA